MGSGKARTGCVQSGVVEEPLFSSRILRSHGTYEWRTGSSREGILHRLDGPAVIRGNGLFSEPDGDKEWWVEGKRHRTGGPAVEYENGDNEWYLNGKRHRVGRPAVVRAN